MSTLKLEYYYGNEADGYSFYRIPKLLFVEERFKRLSVDAKMLYGIMLDRMGLSFKNGWFDKEGKVYIYFTLEEAMETLGYAHTKIIRIMSELDDIKGVGLIVRKKQGQGKPTMIYVKKFTTREIKNADKEKSNERIEQDLAKNLGVITQNSIPLEDIEDEREVQLSESEHSRTIKIRSAEVLDCYTNNTKDSNTKINNTQSINPSNKIVVKMEKELEEQNERGREREELEAEVLRELFERKTLPSTYLDNEEKMRIAISAYTEYEHYKQSVKEKDGDKFYFSVIKLLNEGLVEMLTTEQVMTLKASCIL